MLCMFALEIMRERLQDYSIPAIDEFPSSILFQTEVCSKGTTPSFSKPLEELQNANNTYNSIVFSTMASSAVPAALKKSRSCYQLILRAFGICF